MLLDDKEKTVALFFDNIIRGTITINTTLVPNLPSFVAKELYNYKEKFKTWFILRNQKNERFTKLTNELFYFIFDYRFTGVYVGEMRDSDLELENRDLKEKLKEAIKKATREEIKDELLGDTNTPSADPLVQEQKLDRKNLFDPVQ